MFSDFYLFAQYPSTCSVRHTSSIIWREIYVRNGLRLRATFCVLNCRFSAKLSIAYRCARCFDWRPPGGTVVAGLPHGQWWSLVISGGQWWSLVVGSEQWSVVVAGGRRWSLVVVSQPGRTDKPDTSPESVPPPSNRLWSERRRHRPARAAHQSRSIFKFCLFKLSNRAPLGCGLPAVVIPAACTIPR